MGLARPTLRILKIILGSLTFSWTKCQKLFVLSQQRQRQGLNFEARVSPTFFQPRWISRDPKFQSNRSSNEKFVTNFWLSNLLFTFFSFLRLAKGPIVVFVRRKVEMWRVSGSFGTGFSIFSFRLLLSPIIYNLSM